MKLNRYLFLFICLFTINIISPYADDNCSTQEIIELQRAASQIKTGYTYKEVENYTMLNNVSVEFTISVYNITSDIYIDVFGILGEAKRTLTVNNSSNGVANIYNLPSQSQNEYTLQIKSNKTNCKDKIILSKKIITPKYNEFSQISECKDYPKFALCQKFYNTNATTEDFYNKLDSYIESLEELKKQKEEEKKKEQKKEDKSSIFKQIKKIVNINKKAIAVIILSIIGVCLIIGIIRMIIRKRKVK